MQLAVEILVSALILIGAFFLLVGSYGLAKLPDLMRRLHAPTKSTTLGIGALLLASLAYFMLVQGTLSLHELLITLFLFLTAPVTAFMLAKAFMLRNREEAPQRPTGAGRNWATMAPADPPGGPAPGEDPLRK